MQGRQKKWLAIGSLVSLACAGILLWMAAPEISYYETPAKVGAGGTAASGLIRVGGTVKPGSLQPKTPTAPASLILTDSQRDLPVTLAGELPALLREGQEAVAEGRLVDGKLEAGRVFPRFDDPLKGVK